MKGETKTAFNVGAGVDLKIGITLFIEGKYTWIMTEGETSTYIPISIGSDVLESKEEGKGKKEDRGLRSLFFLFLFLCSAFSFFPFPSSFSLLHLKHPHPLHRPEPPIPFPNAFSRISRTMCGSWGGGRACSRRAHGPRHRVVVRYAGIEKAQGQDHVQEDHCDTVPPQDGRRAPSTGRENGDDVPSDPPGCDGECMPELPQAFAVVPVPP